MSNPLPLADIPAPCWLLLEFLEQESGDDYVIESELPEELLSHYYDELFNESKRVYRISPVLFDPLPLPLRDTITFCATNDLVERRILEEPFRVGIKTYPALRITTRGLSALATYRLHRRKSRASFRPQRRTVAIEFEQQVLAGGNSTNFGRMSGLTLDEIKALEKEGRVPEGMSPIVHHFQSAITHLFEVFDQEGAFPGENLLEAVLNIAPSIGLKTASDKARFTEWLDVLRLLADRIALFIDPPLKNSRSPKTGSIPADLDLLPEHLSWIKEYPHPVVASEFMQVIKKNCEELHKLIGELCTKAQIEDFGAVLLDIRDILQKMKTKRSKYPVAIETMAIGLVVKNPELASNPKVWFAEKLGCDSSYVSKWTTFDTIVQALLKQERAGEIISKGFLKRVEGNDSKADHTVEPFSDEDDPSKIAAEKGL